MEGTKKNRTRAWERWLEFVQFIGLRGHEHLEIFSRVQKHELLLAFCTFIRECQFKTSRSKRLACGSVRDTIGNVSQAFKSLGLADPRYDVDNEVCFRLRQTFRGYENQDPAKKHQKAIPMSVVKLLVRLARHSQDARSMAIAELVELAIFYAMRSCEYSKTCSNEESKRTKILRVRNFTFFYRNVMLTFEDPRLQIADFMLVEFENQKNLEKNERVGMYRSESVELCPVRAGLRLTTRLRSMPGSDNPLDRKVNLFLNKKGTKCEISSYVIRSKLRSAVTAMGEKRLGFTANDIGCHSIRSGGAMAMCLGKVPSYTIMIIGRWKSTAFLDYIRKQVAEFSMDISSLMVTHGDFFTTPDLKMNRGDNDSPVIREESVDGRSIHRGFFRPVNADMLETSACP